MTELDDEREELKQDAAAFISELLKPIKRPNALKPGKGRDLTRYSRSLVRLLEEVADTYQVAVDEYEDQANPDKPKRVLEENLASANDQVAPYDYGEDAGAGLGDWKEFWRRHYHRNAKNPGTNRGEPLRGGPLPPVAPLRPVYYAVCNWWMNEARLGPFNPSFSYESELPYDFAHCNTAARLSILICQWLDPRVTISNVASVHDHMRRHKPPKIY